MRIGGYEVGKELGRGGMARVYRARDASGRDVALKVLDLAAVTADPELVERFLVEIRATARLRHPAIVRVFDAGRDGGYAYLALELLAGGTLAERLRTGPLAGPEAAAIGLRLAEALQAAHAEQVLHRDLKPANVLLDADGQAFLADFGLARLLDTRRMTQTGEVLGTPSYMAPEQALGERDRIGPWTDVYGLGGLLYACLAGQAPFRGRDLLPLLDAVVSEPPPPLPAGVDPALGALALRCLAKEPAERPGLDELLAGLRGWLGGERTPGRRWPARLGAVVALGLAVGGGGLLALRAGGPASGPPSSATTPSRAATPPLGATPPPSPPPSPGAPTWGRLAAAIAQAQELVRVLSFEEAERLLVSVADLVGPETPADVAGEYHRVLGLLHTDLRDAPRALADFTAAAALQPGRVAILLRVAVLRYVVAAGLDQLPLAAPPPLAGSAATEVETALRALREAAPDHPAGLLLAGVVLQSLGRPDEARAALDRYFERGHVSHETIHVPAARDRGLAHVQRARLEPRLDQALWHLEQAAAWPSTQLAAWEEAARRCEAEGLVPLTERYLGKLLERDPRAELYAWRGEVRLGCGEYREAQADFALAAQGGAAVSDREARARQRLGLLAELLELSRREDHTGVLARVVAAVEVDPDYADDAYARFFAGLAHLERGHARGDAAEVEQARTDLRVALQRRPRDVRVIHQTARSERWLGHGYVALYLFLGLAQARPDDFGRQFEVGITLADVGEFALAAELFERIRDRAGAHRSRVELLWLEALNEIGEARRVLEVSQGLAPEWHVQLNRALAAFELGADAEAQRTLAKLWEGQSSLGVEPLSFTPVLVVLLEYGLHELVQRFATELRATGGRAAERVAATLALVDSYASEALGDRARALRVLREARDEGPRSARCVLRELALADTPEAKAKVVQRAAALVEGWGLEPIRVSPLRWGRRWAERALADFDAVRARLLAHPAWGAIEDALRVAAGRCTEAEASLTDRIDAGGDAASGELYLQRGWTRWHAGDLSGAKRDLLEAVHRGPRPERAQLLLARLQREQGQLPAALAVLEELLGALPPEHPLRSQAQFEQLRCQGLATPWR